MKKIVILFLPWLFTAFSYKAIAQETERAKQENENAKLENEKAKQENDKALKEKQNAEEIIIRKLGDKDVKIVVEIKGDKVIINGKPLVEFREDGITVNKRKMTIIDGDNAIAFGGDLKLMKEKLKKLGQGSYNFSFDEGEPRAFLGVSTEQCDDGAKITEITEQSAAAKAGLQLDDIITKIGDKKVDGPGSLYEAVTSHKPKDEVKVYYKRSGKEKSMKVTLGEKKSSFKSYSFSSPEGPKVFSIPSPDADQFRGMEDWSQAMENWRENTPNAYSFGYTFPRKQKLGLKIQDTEESNGVQVLEVEDSSAAANAGIKKDDIIIEIGGVKVSNTDEVRDQLRDNEEKSKYNMKVRRKGTEMSFDIKIPKKLKTADL